MLAGVLTAFKKAPPEISPMTVSSTPPMRPSIMDVWIDLLSCTSSLRPKAWAMTTPAPMLMPVNRFTRAEFSSTLAPTAAEASVPR